MMRKEIQVRIPNGMDASPVAFWYRRQINLKATSIWNMGRQRSTPRASWG